MKEDEFDLLAKILINGFHIDINDIYDQIEVLYPIEQPKPEEPKKPVIERAIKV